MRWKFDISGMLRFARRESIHDCLCLTHDVFLGEEVYRAVQFHPQIYQLYVIGSSANRSLSSMEMRSSAHFEANGMLCDRILTTKCLIMYGLPWPWGSVGRTRISFGGASYGRMYSEVCFAGWVDESLERKGAS